MDHPILYPLSLIYGAAVGLRNGCYERSIFASYDLGIPVISVGNITVGGTGKTPLTAHIAELLNEAGSFPCILTRGYGRRDDKRRVLVSDGVQVLTDVEDGGDEPVELAQRLLGKAAVLADADRVKAAEWALQNLKPDVFILDDGFQHRRAKRDLNIITIDATDPFGNGMLLPAGKLREPLSSLTRADILVITRANLLGGNELEQLSNRLAGLVGSDRVFRSSSHLTCLSTDGFIEDSRGFRYFAFCGIGNPSNFTRQLEMDGFLLAGSKSFPDHYSYAKEDISFLEKEALAAGANALITTEKDRVKLERIKFGLPLHTAKLSTRLDDEERFRSYLLTTLKK
jgi:tetraacyldisaccharide 4'-kinase